MKLAWLLTHGNDDDLTKAVALLQLALDAVALP